jgi:hypothetical protein
VPSKYFVSFFPVFKTEIELAVYRPSISAIRSMRTILTLEDTITGGRKIKHLTAPEQNCAVMDVAMECSKN